MKGPDLRSLRASLLAVAAALLVSCGAEPPRTVPRPAPPLPPSGAVEVAPDDDGYVADPDDAQPAPPSAPDAKVVRTPDDDAPAPDLAPHRADRDAPAPPPDPPEADDGAAPGDDLGGLLGEPEGKLLKVHFIDVGQGDGALIQTPGGKVIVVDTGPPPAKNRFIRYLGDLDIHHVDLLVNSHAHADHIGGAAALLAEFTVGQVLDSGIAHPTPDFDRMLKGIERDGIPIKVARRGRQVQVEEGITLEVLAPEDPLVKGSRSDTNANSLVFRLTYGDVRFLFVGDAEEETEERLLRSESSKLAAQVLKVAHHGSQYASSDSFLRAVKPKLAVISCGRNNVYGHPARQALDRLERAGAKTLITMNHGNIIMATDGKKLKVIHTLRYGGPWAGGRVWRPGTPGAANVAPAGSAPPVLVLDLNAASADELAKLPGVGTKLAERIVAYRKSRGRFSRVEDLDGVVGVGAKLLERLRPHLRIVYSVPSGR